MEAIKIMGAGPAGLTAAITLARAGRPVIVYERAEDVGLRHKGGLEAIENWTADNDVRAEFAQWGLEENFGCVPIRAGTWFGPEFRQHVLIEDRQPLIYLVRRGPQPGSLDRGLLAQAQAAGAQVVFGRACTPAEADIVASGYTRPGAYGVGYTFKTSAPNAAYVCYDNTLTPKSYSYLAICEGYGTLVACGLVPQRGLTAALPRVVAGFRSRVDFDMDEPRYFAACVGLGLPRTAQRAGKLYIGEAAGFQDVFAGFGIRMAIGTGYLAARSLLTGQDYDRLWQARYASLMRAAAVNRWLQEAAGNRGYDAMLWYMRHKAGAGRALVGRLYRPMWFTSLLWPAARRAFAS
jgi:flavin-dependent dehydrogenase